MLTAQKENIFLFAVYQCLSKQSFCRWYRGCFDIVSARDTARHGLRLFTIWNRLLVFFLCFRSSQFCYKDVEVCHSSSIDRRIDHCAILHWMNLLGHTSQYPVVLRGVTQSKTKNCLCAQLQKYQVNPGFRCMKDSEIRAERIYLEDCSKILAPLDVLEIYLCFPSREP